MNLRTRLIQMMVDVNERLIFYPKLKKFYKSTLINKSGNYATNRTIIDIGSNKGQTIDFFLSINSNFQIYGFEPNNSLFIKLKNKYLNRPNIQISNFGISSKKDKLMFQENIMDETSTFEKLNYDSEYLKKKAKILGVTTENIIVNSYEVDVIAISTFLSEHLDLHIDVLKIDVEGHEYDCLLGLFNKTISTDSIRFIQLESHNDDMYMSNQQHSQITKMLNDNGFEERVKFKHGFGDFYEIIYENKNFK